MYAKLVMIIWLVIAGSSYCVMKDGDIKDFPFSAKIVADTVSFGGVIIAPNVILTTAYPAALVNLKEILYVLYGANDAYDTEKILLAAIDKGVPNQAYDVNGNNDVGLIFLKENIDFDNTNARAADLPQSLVMVPPGNMKISGYSTNEVSSSLKFVNVREYNRTDCEIGYKEYRDAKLPNDVSCVVQVDETTADFPLENIGYPVTSGNTVYGLVVFSSLRDVLPASYIKVEPFTSWILKEIKIHQNLH